MKIKEIHIENFKRFNNLIIRGLETARLVLLVGSNGSGKSSVLEACNVWYRNKTHNLSHRELGYYNKIENGSLPENNIEIKFDTQEEARKKHKKVMYFRSAYRNEADFKIDNFRKVDNPCDTLSLKRIIDDDKSVSKNFERLVSKTLSEVYSKDNNNESVEYIREKLIGKIQKSMTNIFEDLILNSIGSPLENGSFYFKKGNVESFHYKNLSAGEKSAFDLLLDLILKIEYYDDSILFIDEPEIHMHTKLQGQLLEEIYNIIPNECQLWITTHSFGMIKKSRELLQKNPNNIAILDFTDHNFDEQITIEPSNIDKILWEKLLSITLDDFADLIMPKYIILCEGDFNGKKRQNFDASIYNTIFNAKYPNILFISAGNCEDLKNKDNVIYKVLSNISNKTKIYKLIDMDDMNDNEVEQYKKDGIIILSRRHLESFLLDDEIIRLFCSNKEVNNDIIDSVLAEKNNILKKSNRNHQKPIDDLKSSKGEIYNMIKEKLSLKQHGSNADAFMKAYLAPLVSDRTQIYKELEQCIIQKVISMAQI